MMRKDRASEGVDSSMRKKGASKFSSEIHKVEAEKRGLGSGML